MKGLDSSRTSLLMIEYLYAAAAAAAVVVVVVFNTVVCDSTFPCFFDNYNGLLAVS